MITSKFLWLVLQQLRKIWVRVVSFAALAILTVVMARFLSGFIPSKWTDQVGAQAVDQVLSILASSMLAVTTFSLSIAVSAFAAAASSATPRATALLQEDTTTQNVLATFLGAFLFSLLGIIALKAGYYDEPGLLVLFIATGAVLVFVVAALLRWISHLMTFGRIEDTLNRVERAASRSVKNRMERPWMGGQPRVAPPRHDGVQINANEIGYVQYVDMKALSECAIELEAQIQLLVLPGSFAHDTRPILSIEGATPDEEQTETLRNAISIGHQRSFDQDPRFGLIVLAEIASRALSPAVNDPGTAIDVIGRLVRVMSDWRSDAESEVIYPRVVVPSIKVSDLVEDGFRPIARDGAALVEVQMRLQKGLTALKDLHPEGFSDPALKMSRYALERIDMVDLNDDERSVIRAVACYTETDKTEQVRV